MPGQGTTIYVTDADDREVLEYDGTTGTPVRRFYYGLGVDEPIAQVELPGNTGSFTIQDRLGSVVAMSDRVSASLSDKYRYGAFGESPQTTGAYRFTGRRLDAETGLAYYRARAYSSELGRFMQLDPIGYRGGLNLYVYAENDPVNLTDPLGTHTGGGGGGGGSSSGGASTKTHNNQNVQVACGQCAFGAVLLLGAAAVVQQQQQQQSSDSDDDSASNQLPSPPTADTQGTPQPDGGDPNEKNESSNDKEAQVNAGNLKNPSRKQLEQAAKLDNYSSAEKWKTGELRLNAKSDIKIDRLGNLYAVPKQGQGPPQPLGIRIFGD